jgi:hypothetical protein
MKKDNVQILMMYVLTIIACIILFNTEAHAETYST